MNRTPIILVLAALTLGQTPEGVKRLEFEVASIKAVATSQAAPMAVPPQNGPDRLQSLTTLRNLILSTYRWNPRVDRAAVVPDPGESGTPFERR